MLNRLKSWLLHVANSDPRHGDATAFYEFKRRLLVKHARFSGHELQEIRKECWGRRDFFGDFEGCRGAKCSRCGGSGIFDLRWVRLERFEWHGHVFHCPAGDTRKCPPLGSVKIFGRIQHRDYGRGSAEAQLWLYLLCGEFRMFWRGLRISRYGSPGCWPLLRLQAVAFEVSIHWPVVRRCYCGRRYVTMHQGRMVCRRCFKGPIRFQAKDEVPF